MNPCGVFNFALLRWEMVVSSYVSFPEYLFKSWSVHMDVFIFNNMDLEAMKLNNLSFLFRFSGTL